MFQHLLLFTKVEANLSQILKRRFSIMFESNVDYYGIRYTHSRVVGNYRNAQQLTRSFKVNQSSLASYNPQKSGRTGRQIEEGSIFPISRFFIPIFSGRSTSACPRISRTLSFGHMASIMRAHDCNVSTKLFSIKKRPRFSRSKNSPDDTTRSADGRSVS